ncbi:MAG: MXAN_5187 C-terminal domain-containing protein [Polyangiaceae bacterium]
MRTKIIAVNAIIVVIVSLLAFAIVRQTLVAATRNPVALTARAKQDAAGAGSRLQLEALEMERWISSKAVEPAATEVVSRATAEARGDAATDFCDKVLNAAKQSGAAGSTPALVMVVDASGKIVGRNGSSLMRGDDLSAVYPTFKNAAVKGMSGSDVWLKRNDQFIVSYAPIRDSAGKPAGELVIGVTITDALSHVAELGSGRGLLLASGGEGEAKIVATSPQTTEEVKGIVASAGLGQAKTAISSGHVSAGEVTGGVVAAAPLEAFGDGKQAAILSMSAESLLDGAGTIPVSILGVMVLGLIMVAASGWMLGNYISQPIGELEEGLLAIINGQEEKRFQMEHQELGGLAFRIDQLLNKLMGIEEDTTDAEGRVSNSSIVPAPAFKDLDENKGGGADPTTDPAYAARLAAEAPDAYYSRIYAEYIAAKKANGEATDHITEETFKARIVSMEEDASQKHGKSVRYHVKHTGKEVVLLAIPLG